MIPGTRRPTVRRTAFRSSRRRSAFSWDDSARRDSIVALGMMYSTPATVTAA